MSKSRNIETLCRACGAKSPFTVYDTISAETDPALTDKVIDGSIFTAVCSSCGAKQFISFPVLFTDRDLECSIYLARSKEEVENLNSGLADGGTSAGLRLRAVLEPTRLSETAAIFDCEYDDRVMLFIKMAMRRELSRNGQEAEALFFSETAVDDVKDKLVFVCRRADGSLFNASWPVEYYTRMEERFRDILPAEDGKYHIYDEAWALSFMGK